MHTPLPMVATAPATATAPTPAASSAARLLDHVQDALAFFRSAAVQVRDPELVAALRNAAGVRALVVADLTAAGVALPHPAPEGVAAFDALRSQFDPHHPEAAANALLASVQHTLGLAAQVFREAVDFRLRRAMQALVGVLRRESQTWQRLARRGAQVA